MLKLHRGGIILVRKFGAIICAGVLTWPMVAFAQTEIRPWSQQSVNLLGSPGLIDMPSAHQLDDGDVAVTISLFDDTFRNSFYFQITPRLSGVFRYSGIDGFLQPDEGFFDRSFDLRYLIAEETPRRPAITIGLQDFGGTGIYSAEYIVATKTFGRVRATVGMGWGRLGSNGGFDNPLGLFSNTLRNRESTIGSLADTGQLDSGNWFRGDAALFGGVQYQLNDRTLLTAEYSSDAYVEETDRVGFDQKIPVNFGATYRFKNGLDAQFALLYGTTVSAQFTYRINPKRPNKRPGGVEPGIGPVTVRAPGAAADLGWTQQSDASTILQANVAKVFAAAGLSLDGLRVSSQRAEVRFRNVAYSNTAQAVGRAARLLTSLMPASIEQFDLVPVTDNGIPASRITIQRTDLEDLEFAPDGTWQSYARAEIADAFPLDSTLKPASQSFPAFSWGIGPFTDFSFFDPDSPIRIDYGISANFRYEPTPGLVFSGLAKKRIGGNREDLPPTNSVIEPVRSNVGLYAAEGDMAIARLTGAYYFRPGQDLYGRVTAGYLETMFGGISTELLWKPIDSRWAFGIEANYVRQRDFDQQFGFQDYDVVTGHASAYWDMGNGYHAQVDAGRYLAGDWGSTLTLDREFKNGVRIGAFATLTDVPFSDFGEGSFDKGIRFSVPLSLFNGQQTKRKVTRTIRPVTRDGGARLNVDSRLYEPIRELHQAGLQDRWGRFWR